VNIGLYTSYRFRLPLEALGCIPNTKGLTTVCVYVWGIYVHECVISRVKKKQSQRQRQRVCVWFQGFVESNTVGSLIIFHTLCLLVDIEITIPSFHTTERNNPNISYNYFRSLIKFLFLYSLELGRNFSLRTFCHFCHHYLQLIGVLTSSCL
jgi:hypothetical protein